MKTCGISAVVPFFNETEVIETFCKAIDAYAKTLSFPLELIFVNDGSSDDTFEKLKHYSFENISKVKLVNLSKNFGSHAAVRAGLKYASFDICTWMGCDLQEPLEMLPLAFSKITNEGFEAVYIEKKTVDVSAGERFFSNVYSGLMRKYAVKNYSSGGTANIVFTAKIRDYVNENVENSSSIMLQIIDAGFKACTLSLDYKARAAGTSKWTLSKKIKLFIDSFVSFSFMPIRLVSYIGIAVFLIGLIIGIQTFINKLLNPDVAVGYSTIVCVLAIGFGITNISLGIIAEYLWRTYEAARGRPPFIVSEVVELKRDDEYTHIC